MFLRRHVLTAISGAILCLGSGPAFAQLKYNLVSSVTLYPQFPTLVSTDPAYVDLPVDEVLGISGTPTSYSMDILSNNRLVTVHVSTGSSFFYPPVSSASAQIFHRTLDLAMYRSSDYLATLRDVWVYPRFSTDDYYVNANTTLDFARKFISKFSGVDSFIRGSFGDPHGEFFGTYVLQRTTTLANRTYALLAAPLPSGDCTGLSPIRLGNSSSCFNPGILDLLDDMLPYGAIKMGDYCKDSTRPDVSGNDTRIVHCGSGWWN